MLLKKNFSPNTKVIFANFSYLTILQVISTFFPLLTYPYLIRLFGAEEYGIYVFCNTIMTYVVILTNFGFNISATKRVSENREDIVETSRILSSICYLKMTIFILSMIIVLFILYFTHFANIPLIIALFGLCVQEIFYPIYFFQGVEQMRYITIVTFVSRLFFVLAVFLVIKRSDQLLDLAVINTLSCIGASIFSIILITKVFHVQFVRVKFERMYNDFRESIPFFFSRISSVIIEKSNVFIIGTLFDYSAVAIYDLCTKVTSLCSVPFSLVAQAVYPNVAKSKDMKIVKKCYKGILIAGSLIVLVVIISANAIVEIIGGNQMIESANILRIMIVYVPITGISYILGASTLVVNGYSKQYNLSNILAFFNYFVLLAVLYTFSCLNIFTITLAYVIPELSIALYRKYVSNKYHLL